MDGHRRVIDVWRHPVGLPVLALAGFGLGIGVLLLNADATDRSDFFVGTDRFRVWAVVIGVQTGFWIAVAGPLWHDLAAAWGTVRRGRLTIAVVVGGVVALLSAQLFITPAQKIPWPLWGQQVKTTALTLIGALLVGLPALTGILLVHQRIRERLTAAAMADDTAVLVRARREVLRYLFEAGTVISLAVLAAGALHQATVPAFVTARKFPPEAVLWYGAFFTVLLGTVFVPAHLALKRFALRIVDEHYPLERMPAPSDAELKGWLERRDVLEGLVQVKASVVSQLEANLFIFAPLLAAVLTHHVALPTLG